ncbi:hypothetical protein IFM89_025477 [Coptis chinensis]|uniref:Peptidase M48 domain-containing protein n=1 Tax=Coptis chinensis TaxID=261450 RepID=A0A835HPN7_9MAGN|nr:hypothetical protein IFM89_025477 [Coptis chinensis]
MSWYRRAKLGITSFHNLTNLTTQLYVGSAIVVVSGFVAGFLFVVVDEFVIHAFAIGGGTIFIFRETLEALTDGDVATVIGHEVEHVVPRHIVKFPRMLSNLRKQEVEADYLGLQFIASAGYDPRVVE